MSKVKISAFEVFSSQGDLKSTINSILKSNSFVSSSSIGSEERPYYMLPKKVAQNQSSIYSALKELLLKLLLRVDSSKLDSTALLIGTSVVDWNLVDSINSSSCSYKKNEYYSRKRSIDSYAKDLSIEFGLSDFTMTINTACTSSANAMLEAKNLIEVGVIEQAIVVGFEIFSPVMSSGFFSMDLLSKTFPRPFDKERDGLVLGEALAGVVLSKSDSNWSLLGGFSNCNSQTITSVSQSGQECLEVMQKALENCSLCVKDLTALKAHATGSLSNDEAEINAIKEMFDSNLIFTALKPYVGHTVGASGVLEIAILMGAIDSGFLPKTLFCDNPIDQKFKPISTHKECDNGVFMCNYFGFGGNNTSLIIEKVI